MKKKVTILVCLLLTMCLYGCGGSNSEPVNMEAFRCQDSIETVFEVLGETEVQNQNDSYYYTYENVNLWGHKGTATFYVRDDKDTIKYFEGEITLNDKESLELISSFSDKYGSFKMEDIMKVNKNYSWQLPTVNGKTGYEDGEVGFDKVVISIHGVYNEESEHSVVFSDEWSYLSDDFYKDYVEGTQENNGNSTGQVIAQGEYDVCGDTIIFSVMVLDDKIHFAASANAKDVDYAHAMLLFSYAACEGVKEACDGYTLRAAYENGGSVTINWDGREYSVRGINADGTTTLTSPDWYKPEEVSLSGSELEEFQKAYETAWAEFAKEFDKSIH